MRIERLGGKGGENWRREGNRPGFRAAVDPAKIPFALRARGHRNVMVSAGASGGHFQVPDR
ncbi:hypothetical protein sS8_0110 [Methylocaldum marinum]|uniref:Uncharacterized protein n=1 Tax=Methylocaldum marinum TaxID=1432792 RepID=A0A286P357_9GAMM|nr:hypothetical protein sS8_0110 [Methylocaldum marinum]